MRCFRPVLVLSLWWILSIGSTTAFTTNTHVTKKHDRQRHHPILDAKFGGAVAGRTPEQPHEMTTTVSPTQSVAQTHQQHVAHLLSHHHNHDVASTSSGAAAAMALAYREYLSGFDGSITDSSNNEDFFGVTTTVVSCILSLLLGFALGYGTWFGTVKSLDTRV